MKPSERIAEIYPTIKRESVGGFKTPYETYTEAIIKYLDELYAQGLLIPENKTPEQRQKEVLERSL